MPKEKSKGIEYYAELARQAERENRDTVDLYNAIDDIDKCRWELPASLRRLPGIRKRVLSDPHDALFAATRLFSTMMPNISVTPFAPNDGEIERVKLLEEWLEHQIFKSARRGGESALWKIVNSAVKYMCVAVQVEYLPYTRKGRNDPKTRYALRNGDYIFHVYDPRSVYADYGDDGPNWVLAISEKTLPALISEFGEDNPGVKKIVSEVSDEDMVEKMYKVYDYTDWENRVRWAENAKEGGGGKQYELLIEKHGLPFFPWAYRKGDHPIMRAVVDANMWDDANLVATLESWMVVSASAHPAYFSVTPSGKGIGISYTNPVGELRGRPGEEVRPLPPRQLDPHVSRILADLRSSIHGTTVTRSLQTLDFGSNTPFATVNAILSAAVASLNMPRRLAEEAIADILYLCLHWIAYSKIPSRSNLMSDRKKGREIVVVGEEPNSDIPQNMIYIHNPEDLEIAVRLQADTPTDRQQRVNMALNLAQLGIPKNAIAEELQIQNYDILREQWMVEQLEEAKLQAHVRKIVGSADLELQMTAQAAQAQQQQMMVQMQAQQMQAQQTEQNPAAQGIGFAPGMGGQPPQIVSPESMTREEVTQRSWTGEELANV